jgi:hypothetical protein
MIGVKRAMSEAGTSAAVHGPGREASTTPPADDPVGLVHMPRSPREGTAGSASPRPPVRGRQKVPRVTRSITRAMLAVRRGPKAKSTK